MVPPTSVLCREVVHISEDPLSEVPLYLMDFIYAAVFNKIINGTFFSLQSTKYTNLFLALSNDNKLTVKGMVSFYSIVLPCVHT